MLLSSFLKKNFSLDIRSLALLRVGLATILLADFLVTRLPYFQLFYTEKGLLPMVDLFRYGKFSTSSLNFISSAPAYQFILFLLALMCFFCLLVGYKTRWAAIGSWLLVVSFYSRDFLIINMGDTLVCMVLFWVLALPLNKCFSVDSALTKRKKNSKEVSHQVFSINSVGLIHQILFLYFFAYMFKKPDGTAVYYVMMLDNFRTVWGDILLKYPEVMTFLSFFTVYFAKYIFYIFLLLGGVWPLRILIIFVACGFHVGLAIFMHLGFFSWICVVGWLAFLPSEFWDKMKKNLPKIKEKPLLLFYDEDCIFCKKAIALIKSFLILPHVQIAPAQSDSKAFLEMAERDSWVVFDSKTGWHGKWDVWVKLVSRSPLLFYLTYFFKLGCYLNIGNWFYTKVAQNRNRMAGFLPNFQQEKSKKPIWNSIVFFFFFCSFIYITIWNVRTTSFKKYPEYIPKVWNGPGAFFHLHQYGDTFFSKTPGKTGWTILVATKSDTKERIDLWNDKKLLSFQKPYRYDLRFPVFRFRKMLENLRKGYKHLVPNYLNYLCLKEQGSIEDIEMIYMLQTIPPPGKELSTATKQSIFKTTCSNKKDKE